MSAHRKNFFTIEEYFALESVGDARYEYWDGEFVCMSGGSEAHNLICSNVHGELFSQLKGKTCRALTAETPIKTPSLPPYRYPDVSAVCGKPEFETIKGTAALTNPILIVEVLSPNTEQVDRGAKFEAYKTIETMREYLLIAQHEPHITHYIKQDNGEWQRSDTADLTASIMLETIGCTLAVSDVYIDVEFK